MKLFLRLVLVAAGVSGAASAQVQFSIQVPTPREHHETYNADAAGLVLMGKVMEKLDPQTRQMVMGLIESGAGPESLPPLEPEQVLAMIDQLGLRPFKPELLEIFLHKSQVLDLCPPEHNEVVAPILHDALLAFMDGLSDERLADRLSAMVKLGPDADRGEKILVLAAKIPTLQKLGQVVARLEAIPPDISAALQSLENELHTMTAGELVAVISESLGPEKVEKYQIVFADEVLAEASVGAVIRATVIEPGGTQREEVVAKLIKPYVLTGVPRELEIIDGLIGIVEEHSEFYNVGNLQLRDLFEDIKAKLAEELRVTQEQGHLAEAVEYFRGNELVRIPKLYSEISNDTVTIMEFLEGEKISDAFSGDKERRAELARRLMHVMTYEALFSKPKTALFHGDPHAGNVMHITGDPSDPYKIGLIDWGLMGRFQRSQRMQMVQLSLALKSKSRKKLHKNVGGLLRGGLPDDPAERERVLGIADGVLQAEGNSAEVYADLVQKLATSGYVLNDNFALYIKSQLTLDGIFRELDPDLDADAYIDKKVHGQVMKEFPKRLLLLPAMSYRGYRSMLSNSDVFKEMFR